MDCKSQVNCLHDSKPSHKKSNKKAHHLKAGDPAENGVKVNDVLTEGEVVTKFLDLAASLRRVAEIMDLCREPSLQLHLIIQHEEILKHVKMVVHLRMRNSNA